jgi:hypothetical protein
MYKWLFILDRFWSNESNKYNIYRLKSRSMHPTDKKMFVALLKKQIYDHNENVYSHA